MLGPAPARAADRGLRVSVDGGAPELVGSAELLGPGLERGTLPVTVLDRDGEREPGAQAHGVEVARLVTFLGLDPTDVSVLAVSSASAHQSDPVRLSPDEVVHGFSGDPLHPDGIAATFFVSNDQQVRFFRPQRTPTDRNGPDRVDPAIGDDLDVAITTAHPAGRLAPFRVGVLRSPGDARTVTFTPVLPAGATYRWDFGDGVRLPAGDGPVVHAYPAGGLYAPTVTARTADGRRGASLPIDPLSFGAAGGGGTATAPAPSAAAPAAAGQGGAGSGGGSAATGGGTAAPQAAATGPRRGRGTGTRSPARPAVPSARRDPRPERRPSRTPTARRTAQPSPATAPAPSARAPASAPGASAPARSAPASSAPAPAAPDPAATSPSGATGAGGADTGAAEARRARARAGAGRPAGSPARPAASPGSPAPAVRGTLVSRPGDDVTAALTAAEALADAPAATTPAAAAARAGAGGGSGGLAGGVAGGGLLVALLAAGAAREGLRGSGRIRPA